MKVKKPRNKPLHDLLISKRGGAHEEKEGKRIKRSKAKQQFHKMLKDVLK